VIKVRYVIESLKLRNFGIHEKFLLEDLKSINLIVGANGVGKTTITDALSLALGGNSDRFHHLKDMKEYIPDGYDTAEVEIRLNNIKNSSGKSLLVSDPEINGNDLTVKLTLRQSGPSWSVNGKGRLNRTQIQRLFTSGTFKIGMQDDIYYTKKNTVDLFMSGSPHEMFNQLFSPLSLAEIREKIEILQGKTRSLQKKLPELQFKRGNLERELKVAEEKKLDYERKEALMQQLEELLDLQKWIKVLELEEQQVQIEKEYLVKSNNLDKLQLKHIEDQEEFNRYIKDKRRLEILIEDNESAQIRVKRKIDSVTSKLMEYKQAISSIEGELSILNSQSSDIQMELELLQKEYQESLKNELILENSVYEEALTMLNSERESLKEEMDDLIRRKEKAEKDIRLIDSQIKKRNLDIEKINADLEKQTGVTITEGENIWANEREALRLSSMISVKEWSSHVTQPLFREIFLTPIGKKFQGAVNYALGEYKSYLLAEGGETLNKLRLVMENGRFRLSAAPVPTSKISSPKVTRDDINKLPLELREVVKATLDEVIEIDDVRIKSFIYGKVKSVFVKEGVHYNTLVAIARRLKCDVITPRPSVFKSDGIFKTNVKHSLSLGSKQVDMSKITRLEDKKQELWDELPTLHLQRQSQLESVNELASEQIHLTSAWSKINSEIQRVLQLNPKRLVINIQTLEKKLLGIENKIQESTAKKLKAEEELSSLSKDVYISELNLLVAQQEEYEVTMKDLARELIFIESRIEQLEQQIAVMTEEYKVLEHELVDLEQKISDLQSTLPEDRPEIMPSSSEIRGGILELQSRISYIKATKDDVHEYHRLHAMIEELDRSKDDLESTLEETVGLLEEQRNNWISTIKQTAQSIQDTANLLLSPRLTLKIGVKNSLNFKKVGLDILFSDGVKPWKRFQTSSGGERSLITLSLFLSLHTLHLNSPVHIIDEFSQRLDEENRSHALRMVIRVLEKIEAIQKERDGEVIIKPQIFLIAPTVTGSHIPDDIDLTYLLKVRAL